MWKPHSPYHATVAFSCCTELVLIRKPQTVVHTEPLLLFAVTPLAFTHTRNPWDFLWLSENHRRDFSQSDCEIAGVQSEYQLPGPCRGCTVSSQAASGWPRTHDEPCQPTLLLFCSGSLTHTYTHAHTLTHTRTHTKTHGTHTHKYTHTQTHAHTIWWLLVTW